MLSFLRAAKYYAAIIGAAVMVAFAGHRATDRNLDSDCDVLREMRMWLEQLNVAIL